MIYVKFVSLKVKIGKNEGESAVGETGWKMTP